MMTTQTNTTHAPIYRKRIGRLQVTVFEDLTQQGKIRFSTYIQRRYKNDNDEWKNGAFSELDLEDLSEARTLALAKIEQRKARYSEQQLG